MSKIVLHQAFYGEVAKSHSLIFSTINDSELKSFLLGFTDRPGSIPPGVVLNPYISGTVFKEYYLFTRSFPDTKAERNGMIFTHVIIIKRNEISSIQSLNSLFNKFITDINVDRSQLTIDYYTPESPNYDLNISSASGYAIAALNELLGEKKPIVFIGDSAEFQRLVCFLWNGFTPELRANFKFRISFSPQDLDPLNSPTIVRSLPELSAKWTQYPVINASSIPMQNLNMGVLNFLAGERGVNGFFSFTESLNGSPLSFDEIKLYNEAFNLYEKLDSLNDCNQIRLLVRILGRICPDPTLGQPIKENAINKLRLFTKEGSGKEILALRNLTLEAFQPQLFKSLKKTIEQFLIEKFNSGKLEDLSISEIVNIAFDSSDKLPWWQKTVIESLKILYSTPNKNLANSLWIVLSGYPQISDNLFKLIPNILENEALFIDSMPSNLSPELYENVKSISENKQWFKLRSKVLLDTLDLFSAISTQITYDEKSEAMNSDGLAYMATLIKSEEFLDMSLKIENSKLYSLSGQLIAKEPKLFKRLDLKNPKSQEIWSYSLRETKDFEFGLPNPIEAANSVLDAINYGSYVNSEIVERISTSKFANILDYRNRKSIWDKLPKLQKERFLVSTASSLLKRICEDKNTETTIEQELIDKITSTGFISEFLYYEKDNMSEVLKVFSAFRILPDRFLADYISNYTKSLSAVTSTLLGQLILDRSWKNSAYEVLSKSKSNVSFRMALNECHDLIDLVDRIFYFMLFGKSISPEEAWDALVILAIDLYPKGPEQEDIWERSGGKVSKLHLNRNSEENWRRAITLLKKGGGGKNLTPYHLLKEMMSDYPSSQQLKFLKEKLFASNKLKKK